MRVRISTPFFPIRTSGAPAGSTPTCCSRQPERAVSSSASSTRQVARRSSAAAAAAARWGSQAHHVTRQTVRMHVTAAAQEVIHPFNVVVILYFIFFCAVFLPHCWALKFNQLKCCVQFARFIAALCTWSVKGFMFQASWGCSVECEEPLYWATGRTFKWSSQLRGDSLSGEAEGSTELSYLPFAKWTCQY